MFHRRINPEKQFINHVMEISDRVDAIENQPAGEIVIRESIRTTDPNTGVQTVFGELPSGEVGFQPFLYDLTPPPIPTVPIVQAEPGTFVISWDGSLQGDIPRDFLRVNVIGHKMNGTNTVLNKPCGTITTPLDFRFVTTDVAAVGETWQFSLESEDYNGNLSTWGPRSASFIMASYITDDGINAALSSLQDEMDDATLAASNAQQAAADAQQAATDASTAAANASNLVGSKSTVLIQPETPTVAQQLATTLWIDTTGNANTPKRWSGSTWVTVTDKVAVDAAAAAVAAQTAAGQAASAAQSAAEAAGTAQTTANGKNTVWYQGTAPTGTSHKQNDIWFNTAADNKISQWNATSNTWDVQLLGNASILANLDAGKITVGTLLASVIGAKSITTDKLVITSTDNLIVEADFGNNGASWGLSTNVTINNTAGRGSLPAMRITGTTATRTSLNQVNKISVGTEDRFRLSMWVKSSAALAIGKVELKLRCYTTATVSTDIVGATNTTALTAGVWTNVDGISPALPANTIAVEFFIAVTNVATGTITDIDFVGATRAADGRLIVDGALDAKTITGPLIQTDNTPIDTSASRGIKWTSAGLKGYNTVGQKTFEILSATGAVNITGTYASGMTPEEGASGKTVRATMGILQFQNYVNAPGIMFESFDTGSQTTTPGGFMFYYFGGIQIRSTLPSNVWSQFRNDSYVWVAQDGLQFTSNNSGRTQIAEAWSTRSTFDSRTFPGSVEAPANTSHMRMATYSSPNAVQADTYAALIGTRSELQAPRGYSYIGNFRYNINTLVYDARVHYTFEYDGTARLSVYDDSNIVRSRTVHNGGAQTGPWQIQSTAEKIDLIGGLNPFGAGTNRSRLVLEDGGAYLFGPTWANYFFATSSVVGMAGNIQINGEAGIKHHRAEFYTTNFANPGGNVSWDTGPVTLDTSATNTRNNDFCQVGPFNGSISFTRAGYYAISCLYVAVSGLPGNGWMKLNHSALGLQGMDSIIGGQKHEAWIHLPPTYYGAGDYVRSQTALSGAHNADTRWKVVRSTLNV